MTVGGLGNGTADDEQSANNELINAQNICDFAIFVQEAVKQVKSPVDGTPICLRIGIHTGPVVAGVAGYYFQYYYYSYQY